MQRRLSFFNPVFPTSALATYPPDRQCPNLNCSGIQADTFLSKSHMAKGTYRRKRERARERERLISGAQVKEKPPMPAEPKNPMPKPRDTPRLPSLVGAVLGLATLLSVPAAVVAFWPRVTVTPSDPVDPEQPFSSSVTIANSLLPLDSVYPSIVLGDVSFMRNGHPIHLDSQHPYGAVFGHDWPRRNMGIDDKTTFALNDLPL